MWVLSKTRYAQVLALSWFQSFCKYTCVKKPSSPNRSWFWCKPLFCVFTFCREPWQETKLDLSQVQRNNMLNYSASIIHWNWFWIPNLYNHNLNLQRAHIVQQHVQHKHKRPCRHQPDWLSTTPINRAAISTGWWVGVVATAPWRWLRLRTTLF